MACKLASEGGQFLLDFLARDLGVAHRGLDRRGALVGSVTQIVGDLLDGPVRLPRAVGEVVPEVVEVDIGNQLPLVFGGLRAQLSEPVVDARLGKPGNTLGGEDVGAFGVPASVMQIIVQRPARLVEEVYVP